MLLTIKLENFLALSDKEPTIILLDKDYPTGHVLREEIQGKTLYFCLKIQLLPYLQDPTGIVDLITKPASGALSVTFPMISSTDLVSK